MNVITTVLDLNEARTQERALIFLWVVWAIHARYSEVVVRRLLESLQEAPPIAVAPYRIDVSDQEGPVWEALKRWLQVEPMAKGNLLWGGAGSLLWVRSGTIAHSVVNAAQVEDDKLLEITREAFGERR